MIEDESQTRARIMALARSVFGDEGLAERWLSSPKERFAGKTPLEMLATKDGLRLVEETLLQAYFGNVG